ncbi:protein translocase subunit SecD [Brevibacillus sp. SYSU BS000544]|uniref:protein translocase subunit SecD n=1 Tax=Brevibacillus sp. SYSU BS000544 TaxID=3416443 RepID=UPI003CE507B3
MNMKRILAFFVTVILTMSIITFTTPTILNGLKLGLDLKGGFEILYEAHPIEAGAKMSKEALKQTANSLEKRANAFGVAEPDVTIEGENRIRVKIAGVSDEKTVRDIMKKPAELSLRGPDGTIELQGADFVEGASQVGVDELNRPIIQIEVKDKEKLKQVTQKLIEKPLAIYLDDQLLSAPTVKSILVDGKATISGDYTQTEAQELSDVINLGALPLKLTEKYTQSVGASLGQQSLEQTIFAGLLASIFILLFMIVIYRVPGFIASVTLIAYTWGLLLLFYWMKATITLPGIAAFILGIGMAVDANIITYERIKEEVRSGKTLLSALRIGSKHSLRTILDANLTTILAGFVLYYIGTGAIQGFALTLILSIILSMVTNVFMSRLLLQLLIKSKLVQKPQHVGVKPEEITGHDFSEGNQLLTEYKGFDYVGKNKIFFTFSTVVTIAGVISMLLFNLNYGVDFKAGTNLDLSMGKQVASAEIESVIAKSGLHPASVTVGGENNDRVSIRFEEVLNADRHEADQLIKALKAEYGDQVSGEENTVDPAIAQELGLKAIYAVAIASIGIIILVSIRFEWRFALAAIIALLHDVFMVVSIFSIGRLEVNLPFVAAVLTIIGYSINDTIVIFDRIRENVRYHKPKTYKQLANLVNNSIAQTLTRSINTGLTVLVSSLILYVLGSDSIQMFSLAMTLGLVFGMYSSIFIASQIWLIMKKNSLK